MPGLVTMKPGLKARGCGVSKAMARAKEERGLGALLSQVRVSPAKKGRRSSLAMRLRTKLLGEEDDLEPELEPEPEPSSVCLAAMVDEFLEDDATDKRIARSRFTFDDGSSNGEEDAKPSLRADLVAVLHKSADSIPERILLSEVTKAVGKYLGDGVTSYLTRHLRRVGHNAGLCKSRWDHSGGFPGGEYEYVDVTFEGASGKRERIIMDVDFKAQFEIARPTAQYDALVQALPSVFVGRHEQLLWIVNLMSEAVKMSLKKRGMHLPPWRKPEYMRAKWFSFYKRTTTDIWESSDGSSEESDVSLVTNASVKSSDMGMGMDVKKVEERPWNVLGFVDNNDWRLPIVKAKKAQGPGHAGLASLFKEGGLKASMRKEQVVKVA